MENVKLKGISIIGIFMIFSLSLLAENLTDGKGLFKSNELRKHIIVEDTKIKILQIKIQKNNDIFIEVLNDFDSDTTFFKWKDDIIPFLGEIIIVDILSNKKNGNFYIFSQSIHSDISYYTVTLMNDKGLRVLGVYQALDIYSDVNIQTLEHIHKGVDYIFKIRDNKKYLYSNSSKKFITNKKNSQGIFLSKIKEYFSVYEKSNLDVIINKNIWKGSYLDKRENWMHGGIHNVNNLFIFFEDKECEIVLDKKNKLKCTIVKKISQEDMPMDKKLKNGFTMMDSILVTHRDEKGNVYKHYFFRDNKGDYSFASWYFTSPTNASVRFPLKKVTNSHSKILKFENYAILSTYTLHNKTLIQKNFGRLYRTLLKKALKEKKPEFAGKHIIAQWGCDDGKNECTTGGIIDASTGKATEFPFKYYAHNENKEIIYKLNSSLIIFAGDFEFKDGRREKNKVLFYEFKDDEFLFLKSKSYGK